MKESLMHEVIFLVVRRQGGMLPLVCYFSVDLMQESDSMTCGCIE